MSTSSVSSSNFDYSTLNQSSSSSSSSSSGTQSTFLKLLVSEMQNQDPLNPMDNSEMTSQLAAISTADQLSALNTTMTNLLSMQTATQATGLIGGKVLTSGVTTWKTVSSIAIDSSGVKLVLSDGTKVSYSDITQISA